LIRVADVADLSLEFGRGKFSGCYVSELGFNFLFKIGIDGVQEDLAGVL